MVAKRNKKVQKFSAIFHQYPPIPLSFFWQSDFPVKRVRGGALLGPVGRSPELLTLNQVLLTYKNGWGQGCGKYRMVKLYHRHHLLIWGLHLVFSLPRDIYISKATKCSTHYVQWKSQGKMAAQNRMDFQKNSKRPSTPPPPLRKIMLQFFYNGYGRIYARRYEGQIV